MEIQGMKLFKRICNEMGINGFGIREVAQKIKHISQSSRI